MNNRMIILSAILLGFPFAALIMMHFEEVGATLTDAITFQVPNSATLYYVGLVALESLLLIKLNGTAIAKWTSAVAVFVLWSASFGIGVSLMLFADYAYVAKAILLCILLAASIVVPIIQVQNSEEREHRI